MKQQTLISKLQSRIDKRANEISYNELFKDDISKELWKEVRHRQATDKRILGTLIVQQRMLRRADRFICELVHKCYIAVVNARKEVP